MKFYYTYTIHFIDGYYYHGRRTSKVPPEEDMYFGTPKAHKDKWLDTMHWRVIEDTYSTPEELEEAEYELIGDKFKTDPYCLNEHNRKKFNMGGREVSEESRQKMSKAKKGREVSEEHKQKISESRKGKKHTEETKQKLSEVKKGKKHTEETKQKMRGKKHTEETKQKMREVKKGENHPFYGKKHTEETKQKISEVKKGKKLSEESKQKMMMSNQLRKEVVIDGVVYSSISEASRITGMGRRTIRKRYQ